jgi:two-component system heavy metal sensor histidine kinase CusS
VCEFFEAAATDAGIRLMVATEGTVQADLDRTLFQQALSNLVANALAHTPPGGSITLCARSEGSRVRVEVTDTGCGIPQAHLPHVFDRFYRVDPARSSRSGGVGLGLAIVHSIMALHHGSATLTSEPGQGTQVCLDFPAAHRPIRRPC